MTPSETRTQDGRFAPGQSGNPAGRPKGARNRGSALAGILQEGDEDRMLGLMAGKALDGNVACLKYCLDRLHPRRRAIRLDLPDGIEHNGAACHAAVLRAAADGTITPEEAATLARAVAARQPVMNAHLIERRLATADHPVAEGVEAYLPSEFLFPCMWEEVEDAAADASPSPSPLAGEGREGGHAGTALPGEPGLQALPSDNVPACAPLPDPPPQGGRGTDAPAALPVNSPVPQAAAPPVKVWGINRIYLEQEKLPKRPGTIRGFIRGSGLP